MEQHHTETAKHDHKINWTVIIVSSITALCIVALIIGALSWKYLKSIDEKNAIEKQKIETDARLEREKMSAEQYAKEAEAEAEKQAEMERQTILSICLSSALRDYSSNWDSSCSTLYDQNETKYSNCYNSMIGYGTGNVEASVYCRKTFPRPKKTDCTLPTPLASRWDEMKKQDEDACYKRYSK